MTRQKRLRQRAFEIVELSKPGDKPSEIYDIVVNGLIIISVLAVYLETFGQLYNQREALFALINIVVTIVFTIDYSLRVWTAPLLYPKKNKKDARKAYTKSGFGIIDFIATFPPYLSIFVDINLGVLRVFRLFRLLRLSKLSGINDTLALFQRVITKKKNELIMTMTIVVGLILIAALFMYYAEHNAQPTVFRNAYDSIYWATVTLTTLGYGDMTPITTLGRFMAMIIALLGIGVIAIPTGILSGGLMEELNDSKVKKKKEEEAEKCPHCGKQLHKQ